MKLWQLLRVQGWRERNVQKCLPKMNKKKKLDLSLNDRDFIVDATVLIEGCSPPYPTNVKDTRLRVATQIFGV